MSIRASELYALSQGRKCTGPLECHYCAGPCDRSIVSDAPPPVQFAKKTSALRPANGYMCVGCYLFHRRSVSVRYLDGTLRDRQIVNRTSFLLTRKHAWALRPGTTNDAARLYALLTDPGEEFSLGIVTDGAESPLHLTPVNDPADLTPESLLRYCLNGKIMEYTSYELSAALRDGDGNGKMPGVQALLRLFGMPPRPQVNDEEERRGRGRPPKMEDGRVLKEKMRKGGR